MHKLLFLITLSCITQIVYSQQLIPKISSTYDNVPIFLAANPLGLTIGTYNLELSIGLTQNVKLGFGSVYKNKNIKIDKEKYNNTVNALSFHASYYINNTITNGPYLKARFVAGSAKLHNKNLQASFNPIFAEALGGYQWIWHNGFNLNLGLGGNWTTIDKLTINTTNNALYKKIQESIAKIGISAELALGLAI